MLKNEYVELVFGRMFRSLVSRSCDSLSVPCMHILFFMFQILQVEFVAVENSEIGNNGLFKMFYDIVCFNGNHFSVLRLLFDFLYIIFFL